MDSSSRKSNKIRDIVRLQQILKKWKKAANSNKSNAASSTSKSSSSNKSIKFLKKTLSFSESSSSSLANGAVPKGFVAVCVGTELKRFVIPTEYLSHQMFGILLREAEEEFGFQQEGVLRFPCEVELFEKVLKMMEEKRSMSSPALDQLDYHDVIINCSDNYSPETELHHHPQMCR
ncbi:auxin-responsive protein SAUR71-like [Salvia miltiorrhiza]|uniref:auxin-responsive protein SAUR71-like n=1 Tax=Salvia miltiorrhiza TaxID=226208 RepID=UPI0025ACB72C|nr:auxin-responsive protein SAUR71-like [Salvia miltiorrhiza]